MSIDKFLATAKAWAALAGAILTALVGTLTPDTSLYKTLTIMLAVVTAVAVYGIPNSGGDIDLRNLDGE
ncbi:MAG TPA: hypothetical protein VLI04_01590 [Nocardioidaceae bacterium]|nr:hypothetical protein [Nocardioidaceae bacterium]